jgi:hypothetical protein
MREEMKSPSSSQTLCDSVGWQVELVKPLRTCKDQVPIFHAQSPSKNRKLSFYSSLESGQKSEVILLQFLGVPSV